MFQPLGREGTMSTWTTPSTKLATARALWGIDRRLFTKAYGNRVYPTLDPCEDSTGYTRDTKWEELALDLDWEGPEEPFGEFATSTFASVERVKVGAEAVFDLVAAVWNKKIQFKKSINHQAVAMCAAETVKLITPSTQITPKLFFNACTENPIYDDAISIYDACDALKYLVKAPSWNDQSDEYIVKHDKIDYRASHYVYRKINGCHFFVGVGPIAQKALFFSKNTYDFLIGALERLENMLDYGFKEYSQSKFNQLVRLLTYQINTAARLRGVTANKVGKAWSEVKTYVQYNILESIMDDAVQAVKDEFVTDGFAEVVSLSDASELITLSDTAFALELIHAYKWIPPPEYDMTKSLPDIRKLHQAGRVSGAHPNATLRQKEIYQEICIERKMNLATAYAGYTGSYPADLKKKGSRPTYDEVKLWNPANTLSYEHMGKEVSNQIKDKTTVRPRLDDEISKPKDIYVQNFLLWYLANQDSIDTNIYLDRLVNGCLEEDTYSRAAYKAENQKIDGRPFFMAPPMRRLLLGEFEGNQSKVARHYPGSLMGRSDATKQKMSENALDVTKINTSLNVSTTTFIVMFDASKWSPKSCGRQVQEYHDFWAAVYGDTRLACLGSIGTNDTILSTTDGITIKYQNKGADLEGYRSRTSTMYHADMLATACRRSIKAGHIAGKSNLVVFVDDGAVKIEAIGTRDKAKGNALAFLEIMKEVYHAGGQEIHSRKVIISERGGEILSNLYFDGVKVPQGLKACMKLSPNYNDPIATLPGEMDSLFAASQGAVKAGANPFKTYYRYIQGVIRAILRYNRYTLEKVSYRALALMLITPKSFGGFGLQAFQALISTAVVNQTAEGVAMLNRVARGYPAYKPAVMKLLRTPVLVRKPLDILRDPTRVRLALPTMVESRMIRVVKDEMKYCNKVFQEMVSGTRVVEATKQAETLANRLLAGNVIPAPLLDKAWKSTLLHEIEATLGKFTKADTIIGILGYRFVGKVRRLNVRDVSKTVEALSGVFSLA